MALHSHKQTNCQLWCPSLTSPNRRQIDAMEAKQAPKKSMLDNKCIKLHNQSRDGGHTGTQTTAHSPETNCLDYSTEDEKTGNLDDQGRRTWVHPWDVHHEVDEGASRTGHAKHKTYTKN